MSSISTVEEKQKPSKAKNKFSIIHRRSYEMKVKASQPIRNRVLFNRHRSIIKVDHDDHLSRLTQTNESNRIIRINVSGNRYETYISTLERYPETLLGNKYKRIYYWNDEEKEYFFDRHRLCFQSILYYYQSRGRLRRPEHVPLDTFLEEISFFQLGTEAIEQINKLENLHIVKTVPLPKWLWQEKIWFTLEYPQQSTIARIIHLFLLILTLISSLALAIETLPEYEEKWNHICKNNANISLSSSYVPRCSTLFSSPFFIIETISVGVFTIEFLLRCLSTPSCRRLIISLVFWIDLTSMIPYYILLSVQLADQQIDLNQTIFILLRVLRFFRFFRIFQIYLIFEQLKSLRVLGATIKEAYVDFLIMVMIITVVACLFGAAAYYTERSVNIQSFDSIPVSTYWAMVTITSLGYGDMSPKTPLGRILSCLCSLFGAAMIAMLVSVLVGHYQRVYDRKNFLPDQERQTIHSSNDNNNETSNTTISNLIERM